MKLQLPASVEAEESVVGAILVHARKFIDAAPIARPDDFHHPALRAIYEAMLELDRASKPIDSLTVLEQMRSLETFDKLRAFGDADYLDELMAKVVTTENIAYHARIVRRKADRRRVILAAQSVAAAGFGQEDDDEFFAYAERSWLEVLNQQDSSRGPRKFKAILRDVGRAVEKRYEHKGEVTGIATPWTRFNELTAGLQPGDMGVIAARPSMGKTAMAGNIVEFAARHGHPCLVFSLEMSDEALVERMISSDGRLDGQRMRLGTMETAHWLRFSQATTRMSEHPIEIDDEGGLRLDQIRSRARRWAMQLKPDGPIPLVVIDYLQLVGAATREGRETNRQEEVAAISRGCKGLAKELKCPVVALSQLNRALEARADKRPTLADLRESGAIEQDADLITFIYRDEVYSKDQCKEEDRGVAEVIVGKQRNGPTGTVRLAWLAPYSRFENLSYRDDGGSTQ